MQPDKNLGDSNKSLRPKPIMDMLPTTPRVKPATANPVRHIRVTQPEPPAQSAKVPDQKPPKPQKDGPGLKFYLIFYLVIIIMAIAGGSTYYILKYKPFKKPVASASAKPATDNTNHITDDTLGIKFAITKDFETVDKATLIKQNPYFVYSFKQNNVDNVACTISQQKRTKPGAAVAPEALRDGTLNSIKKAFTDTKLDDYQDTTLANGQDAASLTLHYTDVKVAIKEKIVVAATKTNVTFAFCTSPAPLYDFYSDKFNPFFDSLEIY